MGQYKFNKKIYTLTGYPVFSASGQDGFANFYEREGEAVIVSAIGINCGICFYATGKWTAIKNTLVLQQGWEVCTLRDVVDTQYGFTASAESEGDVHLLRIMDINKTFIVDWDTVPYCKISPEKYRKYKLKDEDLVISRIGDVGKVAIVENPPEGVFGSYLIRLRIKPNIRITPYYLYYWMRSLIYQEYICSVGEGSTRQNTNAEVIKAGPLLKPPESEILKFSSIAKQLRRKIVLNQKQIMVLRKIRDTLLPLLVFGKLRVEEI